MSNLPDIFFKGITRLIRIFLVTIATVAFLLAVHPCLAQEEKAFQLVKIIPGDIADFTVDNLGNIYLLSPENQLKKLNPAGDSLAVFNDVRRYGKIYSMDVTNPLKILLYYKEFETIVVVDRFLNIINIIDLRNLNIFQAKAFGLAYDNNVWVYDEPLIFARWLIRYRILRLSLTKAGWCICMIQPKAFMSLTTMGPSKTIYRCWAGKISMLLKKIYSAEICNIFLDTRWAMPRCRWNAFHPPIFLPLRSLSCPAPYLYSNKKG